MDRRRKRRGASSWGRALALGGCALALLLSACKSPSKLPRTVPVTKDLRAQAQRATAAAKWDAAAQCWWSIFCASQQKDEHACAETARAMLRLGDPESAIGVLKQGLANHPESAELHELHGDALVQRNFRRAAESCYQKAVEIEPQRAGAWRALGSVRLELGYEKSALEPLRRAVELGLDDAPTWLLVARAARGAGETCAAFDAYERAFERTTADTATLLEASTLCLESIVCRTRPDAVAVCRSWLERATAINPQSIEAHFQLGVLAEVDDRDDAAIEHYLRAVEIDPAYLPALRNLALIYAQRRDVENTRKTVERALELERDPDRRKALEKLLEPASGAVALPIKATARR